ncbi:hypothetical protein [Chromobacterium rhizoryzae]|uniref:hypothetical protein n=1 Tax=Chromobacterium rhizoryzae TaxID=1778675 RepID=UPI001D07C948|nr:hypothetical protein [Chromobacterium rhizoryzae]
MLHAFTRNKSRLYRRYLGHRDHNEKRVPEEDEITALIMGPLAFLPASEIGRFWMALVRWGNPKIVFPKGAVTHAEMAFWPKRRNIEPDMLVTLSWGDDHQLLLVEFKWRAPLSGDDQLYKQWQEYLSHGEREHAWHLFIAPDTTEGSKAIMREDVWDGRLLLRTWFDVLNTLHHLNELNTTHLHRWSEEVIGCLAKLGIRPFRGFKHLSAVEFTSPRGFVFWRGFEGFAQMVTPVIPPLNISQQAFFTVTGGLCG